MAMLAAGIAAVACDDPARRQPAAEEHPCAQPSARGATTSPPPATTAVASTPVGLRAFDGRWVVETAEGSQVAHIEVTREEALIRFGAQTLTGRLRGGSRRYVLSGQPGYLAKVKRRGPVIELRDRDNRLRCRADVHRETIRLTLGDDSAPPLRITPDRHGSHKLAQETKPLGTVTFDGLLGRALVRDPTGDLRFLGAAEQASPLWAVLLLDELDEPLRYILMAELGARGR